jgi:hypothetical protein
LDKTWQFEVTKNDRCCVIFLGRARSDEKVATKEGSEWVLLKSLSTIPLCPRDHIIQEDLINNLYKFLFPTVAVPKLAVSQPAPKLAPTSQNVDLRRLVVHCKKAKYDIYIGRPNPTIPLSNKDCIWGNPFKIGEHGTREVCDY